MPDPINGYTREEVEEIKQGILALDEAEQPRGLRVAAMWLDQVRATDTYIDQATVDRITAHCYWNRPCSDCGAQLGHAHTPGCDVARCLHTGGQRIQCNDRDHDCGTHAWDGVWPGTEEAVEYGFYSYFDNGWHMCGPEHPQASPNLNLLHTGMARWDRDQRRWLIEPKESHRD